MDWCSGLTSRLGLWLGGGAAGSIPRSVFVFCGGENDCVHSLCMGVGVRTALLAFTQLSGITQGVQTVLENWSKAHLETILFNCYFKNCTLCHSYLFIFFFNYICVLFYQGFT